MITYPVDVDNEWFAVADKASGELVPGQKRVRWPRADGMPLKDDGTCAMLQHIYAKRPEDTDYIRVTAQTLAEF